MRVRLFLSALVSLAGGLAAAGGDTAVERFAPAFRADQRLKGVLGQRLALHAEALAQQIEHARKEDSEELGVLVEAAALLCQAMSCGAVEEALPIAAKALAQQGQAWKHPAAFGRGLWGLLRYYEASRDQHLLDAARRLGDAASRAASGWRDADVGVGPLAGPAALLFAYTGERRHLTRGLAPESAEEGAPRLLRSLWARGRLEGVERVGAEEVLSTLTGLVGLYRLTGEAAFLRGAEAGWREIVSKYRYVTGAVSSRGRLREALRGEASASVGEPGVTGEWVRLNFELLRATGEVRYADEIERTLYNHLAALQDGRTGAWASSAPLIGRRKYEAPASGRGAGAALGLSMAVTVFRGSLDGEPAFVLYVPGEAKLPLRAAGSEKRAKFTLETEYPESGLVVVRVGEGGAGRYAIHLRIPSWCPNYTAAVGQASWRGRAGEWLRLERDWREGDEVRIRMEMAVRTIEGGADYPGQVALQRGPQVLALDAEVNPGVPYLHRAAVDPAAALRLAEAPGRVAPGRGRQAYVVTGTALNWTGGRAIAARTKLVLMPFSEAREYRVWLPLVGRLPVGPVALTAFQQEAWSADGIIDGSICDERTDTFRTASSDGREGAWFAVQLDRPEWVERIVFRHGKVMTEGGWFDTTHGKPLVQVKRKRDGAWETVGRLESYPASSGNAPPPLYDGQAFDLKLPTPIQVTAIRVLGAAGGRFSSCAELAAYGPPRDRAAMAAGGAKGTELRLAQGRRM